jgi:hypothetical protein
MIEFDLEGNTLADLGTSRPSAKRLNMNEDLLTTLDRLNEPESTVIVPRLDESFDAHGRAETPNV